MSTSCCLSIPGSTPCCTSGEHSCLHRAKPQTDADLYSGCFAVVFWTAIRMRGGCCAHCADQMDCSFHLPRYLSSPHPHPLLLQSVQMHLYHCLLSAEPYMDGYTSWSQFASSTTFPRLLRCLQAMCQQNQVRYPLPSTPLIRLLIRTVHPISTVCAASTTQCEWQSE